MSQPRLHHTVLGSGPPLLLVHGFPLDHTMWLPVARRLQDRYRVILPDLRGFGRSTVQLADDAVLTMEQHADDLAALLDDLQINEPITLGGLSMGGYIAFAFWRKYATRLAKLILCDTRAAGDTPAAAEGRLAMAQRVLAEGAHVAADAMLPKLFSPTTYTAQPQLVEQTRQVILQTAPATIAAAQRGLAARADMRSALPNIQIPTLVLCGAEDAITPPAEMRELAAALPQARYAEIAEAGHMAPLERPQSCEF